MAVSGTVEHTAVAPKAADANTGIGEGAVPVLEPTGAMAELIVAV